jgi:hypothetical protein
MENGGLTVVDVHVMRVGIAVVGTVEKTHNDILGPFGHKDLGVEERV